MARRYRLFNVQITIGLLVIVFLSCFGIMLWKKANYNNKKSYNDISYVDKSNHKPINRTISKFVADRRRLENLPNIEKSILPNCDLPDNAMGFMEQLLKRLTPRIVPLNYDKSLSLQVAPLKKTSDNYTLVCDGIMSGKRLYLIGTENVRYTPIGNGEAFKKNRDLQWLMGVRDGNWYSGSLLPPKSIKEGSRDRFGKLIEEEHWKHNWKPGLVSKVVYAKDAKNLPDGLFNIVCEDLTFPEKEVQKGSEWKRRVHMNYNENDLEYIYKMTGFASIDGIDTVVISRKREEGSKSVKVYRNELFYLSLNDFMVEYAESERIVESGSQTLKSVLKIRRNDH